MYIFYAFTDMETTSQLVTQCHTAVSEAKNDM